MKSSPVRWRPACLAALVCLLLSELVAQPDDPGWPRIFRQSNRQLTIYQPQVDYWHGYTNIHFRSAIGVKGVLKGERFGVAEVDAITVTDQAARIVALVPVRRDLRFPNTTDAESAALRQAVDDLHPTGQATTLSLDRVLAYVNPAQQPTQSAVDVNLDPPGIFYSRTPAILVVLLGEAQLKPVETNRTDLMFALNTNWDLFYETAGGRYYLRNQASWLMATDLKGPWGPAPSLPPAFTTLPATDNWTEVRKNIPGRNDPNPPAVFVSTVPAELVVTQGEPNFSPVAGTRLLRVSNTESVLFLNAADGQYYYLVAGRWFRARRLDGPWTPASRDLPADFAHIPDSDPAAFVKASVPGTREAKDAVLLASIPALTTVDMTNVTLNVTYAGAPQFVMITNTVVQYAVNTPQQVFLVSGRYYCCDLGIWYVGPAATGPWSYCTSVPSAIYTIPPTSPCHNVTYVVVQSSTPTTVVYSQTAGYSGEYVAATGVLMFGAGMLVGAAIANNNSYYYPPYPCHYSYGCGATYHYAYGGYCYRGGAAYGPYGGAGYTASYNPATGTYARSTYAYGPYGSASTHAAYNPYTGSYTRSAQVNTAYGSAGRASGYNAATGTYAAGGYRSTPYGSAAAGRAYNPSTGATAAGATVSTATGSASRGYAYNPTTGQGATAASRSGANGQVGTVKTTGGGSATAWNTANGQAAVGKTQSGDVYAAKDGTVYKKDASGGWSQNSGSGWESASRPSTMPSTTSRPQNSSMPASSGGSNSWSQNRENLESDARSRSWGNEQSERSRSWSGGGSRGGSYGGSRGRR